MDVMMVKTLTGLVPASDEARDELRPVKLGTVLRCKVHRMRNSAHHRKFFALLNTVWAACDQWPSVDALLTDLELCQKAWKVLCRGSTQKRRLPCRQARRH